MKPRPQRLVQDSLAAACEEEPSKTVIVDEQQTYSYQELYDRSRRFASVLQASGLHQGDRVALQLDNSVDCAVGIFGTLLAGGIFTVVNPQTKADKLAYILNDSGAAFLVAEGHSSAVAEAALSDAPRVRRAFANSRGTERLHGFHEAIETADGDPFPPSTIANDIAALIYTSGTTGRPKGVMLSHGAFVFAVASIAEYLDLDADDRILNVLPLAFTYGLNQLFLTARLGATLLLERSFAFPARTLNRMRDERATVFPAVPTIYVTILGLAHDEPYESVRCLTNAAAGLPPALHEGISQVFPNARLFRMYGLTECQRVCYLEPSLIARKPSSVGRAMPGTQAFVLNEEGKPAAPGEVGILHVRGPHLMTGYWGAPELTDQMLVQGPLPGERMLRTHDHFYADDEGDLFFVDRTDDVIKTRGEKVSSVEVENALHEIPGVRHAAVVGVPDELLGHAIRAYVVLDEGSALDEQAIVRESRRRLENFMVPRDVIVIDELPRTDSGKVRKKSLSREPLPTLHLSALHLTTGDEVESA